MKIKRSIADKLFRAVCLSFSAFLLLLSLLCNIGIMWTEARINELCFDTEALRRENEVLNVRLLNRTSLSELESLATQKLGMQRPGAEQIIFLKLDSNAG